MFFLTINQYAWSSNLSGSTIQSNKIKNDCHETASLRSITQGCDPARSRIPANLAFLSLQRLEERKQIVPIALRQISESL